MNVPPTAQRPSLGETDANQSSAEPVLLALASNENYFPGLYSTIASMLLTLAPARRAALNILDGGVSQLSKTRLDRMISTIRPDTTTKWIQINETEFHEAPLGPGSSRMTYARVALPDLLEASKCLYLDCDILVLRDIAGLFDLSFGQGVVLAAVPDSETVTLGHDAPLVASSFGLPVGNPYYNAGVLLMNLEQLRLEGLLRKSLEFLRVWNGKYRYHDQSALNFLFHGRIDELPEHWNRGAWVFDTQEDNRLDCCLHYTSSKPWLGGKPGPAQEIFERFAMDLGMPVDQDSPAFRRSHRQWLLRNALAPLRATAFPIAAILHQLAGSQEKASSYRKAARYWFEFIRDTPTRRQLHRRRSGQIRKMRFGGGFPLVGL